MAENARPSLVADDLVELARDALKPANPFGRLPLTIDYTRDDGTVETWPTTRSDGRVIAAEYAVMELLVEIRDELHGIPREEEEAPAGNVVAMKKKPVDESDGDELERRLDIAFRDLYLGGRQPATVAAALDVFTRFLREKGLLA